MIARSIIFPLAAVAALLQPAGAASAPIVIESAPSVKVTYADLDLLALAGRETLAKRIAGAAKQVCGPFYSHDLRMIAAARKCHDNAVSSANLQIERLLTNRFAASSADIQMSGSL